MTTVVDFMGEVVAAVSGLLQPTVGAGVFYQHGHLSDITSQLTSYSKTAEFRTRMYPAVFLLQDFEELRGVTFNLEVEATLQLLIVAESDRSYRPPERYSRVFKPVLYPIYEQLMRALESHERLVVGYGGIPVKKIDRLRISNALGDQPPGSGGKMIFNDHLDGVEVKNLNLKILKNCM
jgi:hypothetical protein